MKNKHDEYDFLKKETNIKLLLYELRCMSREYHFYVCFVATKIFLQWNFNVFNF